jgi:carbon monoxide dehydrogenase subunit G
VTTETLRRQVPADPASIALLLAGPAAAELWPGVQAVETAGDATSALVEVPGRGLVAAAVRSRPPVRTPTAFQLSFAVESAALPGLNGVVVIEGTDAGAAGGSEVTLRLDYAGDRTEVLTELATGFLANLTRAAAARSRAA